MTGRRSAVWTVLVLALAGLICVSLRYRSRRAERIGQGDTFWRLRYYVEGRATQSGARFEVAAPCDTRTSRLVRQEMRQAHLRVGPGRSSVAGVRELVGVLEQGVEAEWTLRFDLHLNPRADWASSLEEAVPGAEERSRYLASDAEFPLDAAPVAAAVARLNRVPATRAEMVERIFRFCAEQLAFGGEDAPEDVARVLREGRCGPLGRARAMVALCRANHIPARLACGFLIQEGRRVRPLPWVEVLSGRRWLPYDPTNGFAGRLPYNVVPVRWDGGQVVRAWGVGEVETFFSIVRLPGPPEGTSPPASHAWAMLDLTRLPLEMHRVLSVILLLPLGAVVTCVFRNMIGIETSGRYTPTLLALSFVFADWRSGLLILFAVIPLGLVTRSFLERVQLLVLPRLSIILTLVVCCLVFGVSVLEYFHLTPGVDAVLLPMVILTMVIERFYVTAEEDGLAVAVQRLAGTLVVGVVCYLVLRWEAVARLLLAYPEGHFFTAAVLVMIGRYTGYRLWELWRFRDLA